MANADKLSTTQLIDLLVETNHEWDALHAIDQLIKRKDKACASALVKTLKYDTWQVHVDRAIQQSKETGDYRGAIAAAEYSHTSTVPLRIKAIALLHELVGADAFDALHEVLENADDDTYVQQAAVEALEKIGTPDALEAVENWRARQAAE